MRSDCTMPGSSAGSDAPKSQSEAQQRDVSLNADAAISTAQSRPATVPNSRDSEVASWVRGVARGKRLRSSANVELEEGNNEDGVQPPSQRPRTEGNGPASWEGSTVADGGSPTEVATEPNTDNGSPSVGDPVHGDREHMEGPARCNPSQGLHVTEDGIFTEGILGSCLKCGDRQSIRSE